MRRPRRRTVGRPRRRPPRPVQRIRRIRPRKWVEVVLRMPVDANIDVDLKVTDLGRRKK